MKYSLFLILFTLLFLQSCFTVKDGDYKIPPLNFTQMRLYTVVDSSIVDSIIIKSAFEHEKLTNKTATCFRFCYSEISRTYSIRSSSYFYTTYSQAYQYGFIYYKGYILLLADLPSEKEIFRLTNDTCYVTSFYGMEDISYSEFDSTFKFIKSENGLVVLDDSHLKKSHRLLRFFKKKKK